MAKIESSLVLFFLLGLCTGCVDCENVATGTNYTLKAGITGPIELGDWRYNGNLVVEWDIKNKVLDWYRFQDRAKLNLANGDLTVRLKKEDSGVFKAQFQVNEVLQYYEMPIKVIDPLTKPEVTCKQNDQNITLNCSLEPLVKAAFKWTGPNGFSHDGNSVQLLRNENGDSVYYCIAENEVSTVSTEFNLKNCPVKGSSEEPRHYTGPIVGSIVPAIAVIIAVVVLYIKRNSWLKFFGAAHGKESTPAGGKQPQSNSHSPDDVHVPLSQHAPNQDV